MKNILQQLEDSVTNLNRKNEFLIPRIKLTVFYVLYVVLILSILSFAIYWFFLDNLDIKNVFPEPVLQRVENHLREESHGIEKMSSELKERLQNIIVTVDIVIILLSTFFAYFLAKKTLAPVEKILKNHKQFSSDVAHELRTPLSVLKAGIEYTLIKDRSATEYKELLLEQSGEIDYLVAVSNDLLEATKIQEYKVAKEKISISELCEDQFVLMQNYFLAKKIKFTKDIEKNISLDIDHIKIKRVLHNILKNSVDYSHEGGEVSLQLCRKGSVVVISIIDNGIGIAKEDSERIFDQFYKVDQSRERSESGAGLGLYMANQIIKAHGGTIKCESEIGIGSSFIITLP